jgi:hypothetical protein
MLEDGRGRPWPAQSLATGPVASKLATEEKKCRRGFEVFIAATPFAVGA